MLMVHFSGLAAWLKEPLSQRALEDVRQTEMIQQAWADSGKVYGYRKLHDDLLDQGETCSENRVARLASMSRASQRRLATNVVLASMAANQQSSLTTHWTGSGATEIEVKERKDRVDDALNATRAAVEEGVAPGGGVALVHAGKVLQGLTGDNPDQSAGIAIIRKALQAPLRQIAENAGVDGSVVAGKIVENTSKTFGYDAQSEQYGDMLKAGIIDPTKVVRIALQYAASVAGLLITTEAMIADKPAKAGGNAMSGMDGMGGMGGMM
jgi:hypothetical protein